MSIQVGEKLPEATFTQMTDDGPQPASTADIFGGRKVVLFAVPGAFTPTCHQNHLSGFLADADNIRARGVDAIACVAVNDVFVMDAWANHAGASDSIRFLSDGNADFTRTIGLDLDASGFGMGTRSQRYAMIVDDGVVTALNVEPDATQAEVSAAAAILRQL